MLGLEKDYEVFLIEESSRIRRVVLIAGFESWEGENKESYEDESKNWNGGQGFSEKMIQVASLDQNGGFGCFFLF